MESIQMSVFPYPPWATRQEACKLFGVGKDQLNDWVGKGYVLRRGQNTSKQYRCADIDAVMIAEATGKSPKRAGATRFAREIRQEGK